MLSSHPHKLEIWYILCMKPLFWPCLGSKKKRSWTCTLSIHCDMITFAAQQILHVCFAWLCRIIASRFPPWSWRLTWCSIQDNIYIYIFLPAVKNPNCYARIYITKYNFLIFFCNFNILLNLHASRTKFERGVNYPDQENSWLHNPWIWVLGIEARNFRE